MLSRALLLTLLPIVGCSPPEGATHPMSGRSALLPSPFKLPAEATMVTSCQPAPLELCFNGKDDNCNGLIDEGCGEETGELQFVLAWGDKSRKVDLEVFGPSGKGASKKDREGPSGLVYSRDCPDEGCGGQNVEDIFLAPGAEPMPGHYVVAIHAEQAADRNSEMATLGVRVVDRTIQIALELPPEDATLEVSFDLSHAP